MQRFQDSARHVQYVRVGPFSSYETAAGTRQKILGKYRDAIVVPSVRVQWGAFSVDTTDNGLLSYPY